jgi:hypothetical protein
MAQTDTRPAFRLPWTTEREEGGSPVDVDGSTPHENASPATIDGAAGPDADAPQSADGAASAESASTSRRPTKFMADLSRAMQAAAEQARDETMTRFDADAKTVVDDINAASTVEAANLRRRADDDVAAVREWSKVEIARIRELTEQRIAERKTALDGEMEAHASVVEARIERVGARVAAFRSDMDAFFGRLLAEEDPTRIATMAELMPDPPSLAEIAASIPEPAPTPFVAAPPAASLEPAATVVEPALPDEPAIDFAAAEAEAADFTAELDADQADGPSGAPARPGDGAGSDAERPAGGRITTRVVVLGLVSVASIASFKRELGRARGVAAIGVASGPDGEFVFSVTHDDGLDLAGAITALDGFATRITGQSAETLEVAAQDPDAAG